MKLLTKLTLFITLSKLLIVILFVLLLPSLIDYVGFEYSNYYLAQQKQKVLDVIKKNNIDYYLQGDSAYGSYTMLKEEYISLVPAAAPVSADSIETSIRIIEGDTLNYRVLIHHLNYGGENYILEIGKTTDTISEYNSLLQQFALYVLIALIILSILVDLIYTNVLLRPLAKIVRSKLLNRKFPFNEQLHPIHTSTTDFQILDRSLISLMETIHVAFYKEREFTSNASHELMTPISILQTNIENMMLDETSTDSQQEKLSAMMKTVNRLKKIVHALLYISRIENDQYGKDQEVTITALIEAIMQELASRVEAKELGFTNDIPAFVRLTGINHDLLFQLFYNLIHNAIRYNKEGGTIRISGAFSQNGSYIIKIQDSGIGIQSGDIDTIFDRFKKSSQAGEGYGLGLSIVKSIVVFHGFAIHINSLPGQGTAVSITVPPGIAQS